MRLNNFVREQILTSFKKAMDPHPENFEKLRPEIYEGVYSMHDKVTRHYIDTHKDWMRKVFDVYVVLRPSDVLNSPDYSSPRHSVVVPFGIPFKNAKAKNELTTDWKFLPEAIQLRIKTALLADHDFNKKCKNALAVVDGLLYKHRSIKRLIEEAPWLERFVPIEEKLKATNSEILPASFFEDLKTLGVCKEAPKK